MEGEQLSSGNVNAISDFFTTCIEESEAIARPSLYFHAIFVKVQLRKSTWLIRQSDHA